MDGVPLKDLFEAITLEDVRRFVSEGQEETLTLEFKSLESADLSHASDRRNFATALSGFANSSGGLLVWGVKARRATPDAPDVAVALQPITPLKVALTRLNELTASSVHPPVDGVRHRAIESGSDVGVVITMVPESLAGPHMAKNREDRYYKRSGDTFYRMEHFDIQDMFGRRARPDLVLDWTLNQNGTISSGGSFTRRGLIILSISNQGRGIARAPFLMIDIESDHQIAAHGITGNREEGLPRIPHAENRRSHHEYGGDMQRVIHPHTQLDVVAVEVHATRVGERIVPAKQLSLAYALAADGFPRTDYFLEISGEEIMEYLGAP